MPVNTEADCTGRTVALRYVGGTIMRGVQECISVIALVVQEPTGAEVAP
jgi:hypothetical protein